MYGFMASNIGKGTPVVYDKVKWTLEQAMKAHRGSRGKLYCSFNLGVRWVGG
jgi:hypothetical protein